MPTRFSSFGGHFGKHFGWGGRGSHMLSNTAGNFYIDKFNIAPHKYKALSEDRTHCNHEFRRDLPTKHCFIAGHYNMYFLSLVYSSPSLKM